MTPAIQNKLACVLLALAAGLITLSQVGCDDLTQLAAEAEAAAERLPQQASDQRWLEQHNQSQNSNQTNHANANSGSATAPQQIIIGSFNIQSFGKAKMSNPTVVGALVDIARRFDILAIQELREKDQTVIPQFLSYINQDGAAYAAAVGPRQGYMLSLIHI